VAFPSCRPRLPGAGAGWTARQRVGLLDQAHIHLTNEARAARSLPLACVVGPHWRDKAYVRDVIQVGIGCTRHDPGEVLARMRAPVRGLVRCCNGACGMSSLMPARVMISTWWILLWVSWLDAVRGCSGPGSSGQDLGPSAGGSVQDQPPRAASTRGVSWLHLARITGCAVGFGSRPRHRDLIAID